MMQMSRRFGRTTNASKGSRQPNGNWNASQYVCMSAPMRAAVAVKRVCTVLSYSVRSMQYYWRFAPWSWHANRCMNNGMSYINTHGQLYRHQNVLRPVVGRVRMGDIYLEVHASMTTRFRFGKILQKINYSLFAVMFDGFLQCKCTRRKRENIRCHVHIQIASNGK